MAASPKKPTPDEVWLQKTFGAKLDKIEAQFLDGGKLRKKFLSDLDELKALYLGCEERWKEAAANRDLTPEQRAALKEAVKMRSAAEKQAKTCDVAGAGQSLMASLSELNTALQRPATGEPLKNLGQRMAGTVVR